MVQPRILPSVANFKYGAADTNAIQPAPRLGFWMTQLRWFLIPITERLQECATTLQECHFCFVADSDRSSSQRRSDDTHKNSSSSIHSYFLMGKPKKVRKENDGSNVVHFSRKLERALKNRKVMDITGEDGDTHNQWRVGDSGAGCSVITNADLLTDIQDAPDGKTTTTHCNSGVTTTRKQGHLKGYGLVWHDPNGIANTISLGKCSTR